MIRIHRDVIRSTRAFGRLATAEDVERWRALTQPYVVRRDSLGRLTREPLGRSVADLESISENE